jgi:glycosyltransferase involved in cell wall biosynthesis
VNDKRLQILFATPAYWPAIEFGGPIPKLKALAEGLSDAGHTVRVVTTALEHVGGPASWRTTRRTVAGVPVEYAATPWSYRWMGVTPTLPLLLQRGPKPDVVHVFGFRDVVTTTTAAWCIVRRVPYVFEPLGMLRPRLRKIALKRAFDAGIAGLVPRHAALVISTSRLEQRDVLDSGVDPARAEVRPNGFPTAAAGEPGDGGLRSTLGIGTAPVALYVGRVAAGKGIEFLIECARALPELHVVLAGPDDGHGVGRVVEDAASAAETRGRIHWLGRHEAPQTLYPEADVFVLASAGESFGNSAAEAAAAGTPIVVSDRCGIAELLDRHNAALVVPYDRAAVTDAIARVLDDQALAARIGAAARKVARELSWQHVVEQQTQIYRTVLGAR